MRESEDQAWMEAFDWMVEIDRAPHDPAIKAGFQAWLGRRENHAMIFGEVRKVWEAAPHMPPKLAGQWQQRGRTNVMAMPSRRPPVSRRQWLIGAAAASVAAAFAAGNLIDFRADHATGTGERKDVALADGSQIQLDTNSAIRIAFGPHQREIVLLRGRAFFAVEKDPQRPFAVTAGNAQAIALGTRFDVRHDGSQVAVAVEEGQVAVTLDGRNLLTHGILTGGEALALDLSTGAARETNISPEVMGAWREDRLVVDGWSVAQVLDELGRYHRGIILLRDEALGARLVSGVYDLRRPIEALRAVAEAQGGRVTEISPWFLVISAA